MPLSPAPADQHSAQPGPQNFADAPLDPFVDLLERLSATKKTGKRGRILEAFFKAHRKFVGNDFYPVLRLLLPQKDRERAVYGLKEQNLAKTYVKLLGLQQNDPDSLRLIRWKAPSAGEGAGDFSRVLCEVIQKRSSTIESEMSLSELNEVLDGLCKAHEGKNSQEAQARVLRKIYNQTTPAAQGWIARIILKDLDISMTEAAVLPVLHPDARDLYNVCGDLRKVAHDLFNIEARLAKEEKEIQLFKPFLPMLCERPTKRIEGIVKSMGKDAFIIDEKLDGERIQLHMRNGQYRYFSRNGNDLTHLYGGNNEEGSLTPFLRGVFDPRVESVVLDGEMLAWDPASKRILPFGTLRGAAKERPKGRNAPQPCFVVFDLLFLNEDCLLDFSLKKRRRNMLHVIEALEGRIQFVSSRKGNTAKDVREALTDVMEKNGEGLVLKHLLAKYILNGRNSDWVKVKPDYVDGMGETMDLIVVGGTFGSGDRAGGVSTLIFAALDDTTNTAGLQRYATFASSGSGLTFADLAWIRQKPWKTWDAKRGPKFLTTAKGSKDKGDVYLEIEDSFIVTVRAAEIIPSDAYGMRLTLRFPRIMRIRDDLSVADCMRASEVTQARAGNRKRKLEGDIEPQSKKRKATVAPKKPTMGPAYEGPNLSKIVVTGGLFNGMGFVVMSDPKSRTGEQDKRKICELIAKHGGKYFQIPKKKPGLQLYIVYGGTMTPYDLKLAIQKDEFDVLKPEWIQTSVDRGKLAPFQKKYFFHATKRRADSDEYESIEVEESAGASAVESVTEDESVTEEESDEEQAARQYVAANERHVGKDDPHAAWFTSCDAREPEHLNEEISEADGDSDIEEADLEAWFAPLDEEEAFGSVTQPMSSGTVGPGAVHEENMEDGKESARMGETNDASEYDPGLLFRHLVFYFDTHPNAREHSMLVPECLLKHGQGIEESFKGLKVLIEQNGGKVTKDLREPKLTHVLVDPRDGSRTKELIKCTSKPKRRHIVISEWIGACIAEETLLDETEFAP